MDLHSTGWSTHVGALMHEYHVPGLAIATVQNGSVSSRGFGNATLSPLTPCTADTVFDIASSSKSFTAVSVAMLVDDNANYPELQYESTMSSLLPGDFVMSDPEYTKNVTVADLLGHRSGLPRHDYSYMSPRAAHPDDARSITRNLRNLPVAAPIRSKFIYCNIMYTVLSYLVEVKSKLGFSDFLHKHIFGPLDMQSTAYQPSGVKAKGLEDRVAMSYYWDEDKSEYVSIYTEEDPEAQGADAIFTSVNDFIKWVEALMDHPGIPINDKMYQGLVELRSFSSPGVKHLDPYTSPTFYTAGLEIYYYKGYAVVGHDGHDSGYASFFFFIPDLHFGAAILGNSDGANDLFPHLAKELVHEVVDAKSSERNTTDWKLSQAPVLNRTKRRDEPPASTPLPQETPIGMYVGNYSNPGYHEMVLEIKDGNLFINASDRSMGFTLTFEHISNRTEYIAHMSDWQEGGDDPIKASFVFKGDHVVQMGLDLEEDLPSLIWFDKLIE